MLRKLTRLTILTSLLVLFVSGCARTHANDYCLIADKITYTVSESNRWTNSHVRQIDNHNEKYKELCD